jgi:hypothetical protein
VVSAAGAFLERLCGADWNRSDLKWHSAFKQPESKNAATTLAWMAALLATMFIGTSVDGLSYQVHPRESETVISQFARIIFTGPMGWFYYIVQATTALILVLAANTSFADFPRLASLLARDRFLPRQFATEATSWFSRMALSFSLYSHACGDRFRRRHESFDSALRGGSVPVIYSVADRHGAAWLRVGRTKPQSAAAAPGNGIECQHDGDGQLVAPAKLKEARHWKKSIAINGLGAIATSIVLVVLVITKFLHGAWIVVLLIPLLVALFRKIHRHYLDIAAQLTTEGLQKLRPVQHEVIVPISGIHRGVLQAFEYAKTIANGHITALYINVDEEATQKLRAKWTALSKASSW